MKVVKINFDALMRAKNHDHFWREVSNILFEKGFHYDAPSCERKFLQAKTLYRNYVLEKKRTGGVGPSCDQNARSRSLFWNDDMHFIMEKDDIANPAMTVSIGSSNIVAMGEPRCKASVCHQEEDIPSIARSRIPSLKRPKSKSDAKTEAYLQMVAVTNRRTDVLMGLKKSNEKCDFELEDEEEEMRRGEY